MSVVSESEYRAAHADAAQLAAEAYARHLSACPRCRKRCGCVQCRDRFAALCPRGLLLQTTAAGLAERAK